MGEAATKIGLPGFDRRKSCKEEVSCCCIAILVYCSVIDWTRICNVRGFENFIGFVEDFFPLWRADLKMSGFAVESVGRVRTEAVAGTRKVADSKISGYVWTRP